MTTLLLALLLAQADVKVEPGSGKGFDKLVARSATYEIRSDADAAALREIAGWLEDLHRGFVTEFKEQLAGEDKPLKVRIYKTQQSLAKAQPMAGMGAGGFYDPSSRTLHVSMQAKPDDWRMVLRHEATHQMLHLRLGIGAGQPGQTSAIWFNEGFASYWATARWKGDKLVTGGMHAFLLKELRKMQKSNQLLTIRKLVGGQPDMMRMHAYYAEGWALCHFLRHGSHRAKFPAYLACERKGEISFEAFLKAFDIRDADALEKEFLEYLDTLGTH